VMDPRPDLKYDSEDWTALLTTVEQECPTEFLAALHGMRCGGLRLHRGRDGYVLRPDYDPATSMWRNTAQYCADRDRWLVPWQDTIVRYLDRLTKAKTA